MGFSRSYRFQVQGELSPNWMDWFEGLEIKVQTDGTTLLTGRLPDQSALHGILQKIRDVGLVLLLVEVIEEQD